jgi:hypothetical protein
MKKLIWIVGILLIGTILGCGGGGSGASDDGGGGTPPVTLTEIQVEPQEETILVGMTKPFTATGIYSDSTMVDLTAQVTWGSSNTNIATITSGGVAEGIGSGTAVITATYTNGDGTFTSTSNLDVRATTLLSIEVNPSNSSIPVQITQQFTAEGCDADGYCYDLTNDATWESSNTAVATIDAAGLASGMGAGTTTIKATFDLISGETTLTVKDVTLESIEVDPSLASIARGTTQQFAARGTFDDASVYDITSDVTWTSSNTGVATISNTAPYKGLASAIAAGSVTITAAFGSVEGTANLTVKNVTLTSITLTPANPTTAIGWPLQFTATGTFSDSTTQDITSQVTWMSSAGNVARISNVYGSYGLATPLHTGTTTISATYAPNGVTATTVLTVGSVTLTSITVICTPSTVEEGGTAVCRAEGNFGSYTRDITNSVNTTWTSSNRSIAYVINVPKKNKGIVTGLNDGTVTITAKDRKGTVSGDATLAVIPVP